MDWKKRGLLTAFAVLLLVFASVAIPAITRRVSTLAEAQALIGTSTKIEKIGCKVYSIEGILTMKGFEGYKVNYAMEYNLEGEDGRMHKSREGVRTTFTENDTEAGVAAAIELTCISDWDSAKTKYGTIIDKVIIEAKINPILNKLFDPETRKWNAAIVE